MSIYARVKNRFYQDSLKLMRVSAEIAQMEGIEQAFAFMATDINKKTRVQVGLVPDEVQNAGPDDLVLLVKCDNETQALAALDAFEAQIASSAQASSGEAKEAPPATFEEGILKQAANLAVISVPGTYVTVQTMTALSLGMNVQLFSDNVSVEDEIALKDFANEKGLLVMGPDCGTSIISGVPICFANKVRSGNVGIVGASGTGLQEFTVLLDAAGYGITHAIGTGGRDLSEAVGGRTALAALELLADDANTEIIVVVSKPPAKSAEEKVINAVKKLGKPAVLAFLGTESAQLSPTLYVAGTIEEAVAKTVALCKSENPANETVLYKREPLPQALEDEINRLSATRTLVRGFYTGGTLASEAKFILKGCEASVIDLGDDEYTRGSVHPMIDPSSRRPHILAAFENTNTAVLLCDVVIGFGSHANPAGMLAQDVTEARMKTGANVVVIASVTGTDADPQNRREQVKMLEDAGIWVFPSNQYAAETAAQIAKKLQRRA